MQTERDPICDGEYMYGNGTSDGNSCFAHALRQIPYVNEN